MNHLLRSSPAHRQRGMTLIEILVTVVLISVGLLGVAALQMTTLKSNHEAYARSQASVLAADILDRMRANRDGVQRGDYGNPTIDFNGTGDATTLAGLDIQAWQLAIDEILPGGAIAAAGRIDVQRDGDMNIVTITIRWAERADESTRRTTANDALPTFQTRTEI